MSTVSARARGNQPLYLAGVESNLKPGLYKDLIESARARGAEYSKIWDLFAFQPSFTTASPVSPRGCCGRLPPLLRQCAN
jgi:hypothetical protein